MPSMGWYGLEDLEDVADGRLVVRKRDLELALDAHLLVADEGTVDADALAVALGEDLTGIGVEQLILEAGAPASTTSTFMDLPS